MIFFKQRLLGRQTCSSTASGASVTHIPTSVVFQKDIIWATEGRRVWGGTEDVCVSVPNGEHAKVMQRSQALRLTGPPRVPPPPSAWVETQPGSGARRGIFRIFGGSLFMENLGPQAALMGINDKTFLGIHIHWEHHRTPN